MSDDTDIDFESLIQPRFPKRVGPADAAHLQSVTTDEPEVKKSPAKAPVKRKPTKQGSRGSAKTDAQAKTGRRVQLAFYGDRADTITTAHVDWISRHPESLLRLGALPTMNAFLCAALEAGLDAAEKDPDLILDRLPQRGTQP